MSGKHKKCVVSSFHFFFFCSVYAKDPVFYISPADINAGGESYKALLSLGFPKLKRGRNVGVAAPGAVQIPRPGTVRVSANIDEDGESEVEVRPDDYVAEPPLKRCATEVTEVLSDDEDLIGRQESVLVEYQVETLVSATWSERFQEREFIVKFVGFDAVETAWESDIPDKFVEQFDQREQERKRIEKRAKNAAAHKATQTNY